MITLLSFWIVAATAAPALQLLVRQPNEACDRLAAQDPQWKPSGAVFPKSLLVSSGRVKLAVCDAYDGMAIVRPGIYRFAANSEIWPVAAVDATGCIQLLAQFGGVGCNAVRIECRPDGGLALIEEIEDGSDSYPFLERVVRCDARGCSLGEPRCVLSVPAGAHADAIARVRQETRRTFDAFDRGRQNRPRFGDYLAMVEKYSRGLLVRALSGDAEAADLLVHFPFELDAAPAEVVAAHQGTLAEARRLHCLAPARR